jgi:hypothetical protein
MSILIGTEITEEESRNGWYISITQAQAYDYLLNHNTSRIYSVAHMGTVQMMVNGKLVTYQTATTYSYFRKMSTYQPQVAIASLPIYERVALAKETQALATTETPLIPTAPSPTQALATTETPKEAQNNPIWWLPIIAIILIVIAWLGTKRKKRVRW